MITGVQKSSSLLHQANTTSILLLQSARTESWGTYIKIEKCDNMINIMAVFIAHPLKATHR
jgi:hypothetical protein